MDQDVATMFIAQVAGNVALIHNVIRHLRSAVLEGAIVIQDIPVVTKIIVAPLELIVAVDLHAVDSICECCQED